MEKKKSTMWEINSASGFCVSSLTFFQFVLCLPELIVFEVAGVFNVGILGESCGYFLHICLWL